jgi:hypothetical protein
VCNDMLYHYPLDIAMSLRCLRMIVQIPKFEIDSVYNYSNIEGKKEGP